MPDILQNLPEAALSEPEEQAFGRLLASRKFSKEEKEKAREMLVLHSMREAFLYARRCCRSGIPPEEIYSLCYSALCRAAENFKPRKIRFFGYAKVFIRGEISREWSNKSLVKNVPVEKIEELPPIQEHDHFEENSTKRRGVSQHDAARTTMPDFGGLDARELWTVIGPLLERRLTESERTVIMMRYKQDLTFREIGTLLGRTKQWAQILHAEALVKLRTAVARNKEIL